ncbi:MAG: hypothetical protein ACKV0T_24000 [Planctomycetales bacterium]
MPVAFPEGFPLATLERTHRRKAFYQRWDLQELLGYPYRLFLSTQTLEALMNVSSVRRPVACRCCSRRKVWKGQVSKLKLALNCRIASEPGSNQSISVPVTRSLSCLTMDFMVVGCDG